MRRRSRRRARAGRARSARAPAAERERFLLVVRHVEKRHAEPALQALELDLHVTAHLQVERPERLVEQQEPGLVDEGLRQGHALLLSARKLTGKPLDHRAHVDLDQRIGHPSRDLLVRELLQFQAECDVVEHREVRKQRVVLEDRVDGAPVRKLLRQGGAVHLQTARTSFFHRAHGLPDPPPALALRGRNDRRRVFQIEARNGCSRNIDRPPGRSDTLRRLLRDERREGGLQAVGLYGVGGCEKPRINGEHKIWGLTSGDDVFSQIGRLVAGSSLPAMNTRCVRTLGRVTRRAGAQRRSREEA